MSFIGLYYGVPPKPPEPLMLTYKFETQAELNISLQIQYLAQGTIVDWGDNTTPTIVTGYTITHTYTILGTYTLKAYPPNTTVAFTSSTTRFGHPALVSLDSWGDGNIVGIRLGDTYSYPNRRSPKLTSVPNYLPPTAQHLTAMFGGCSSFNDPNVLTWDTKNVRGLTDMFESAINFNQPIGHWNISNVTSLSRTFSYPFSGQPMTFNQDISNWDTSNVTSAVSTFQGCGTFNQPIGNWDVSKITNMTQMFNGCTSFNQDLSMWCVPLITSKPTNFDNATLAWDKVGRQPVWGTCPN